MMVLRVPIFRMFLLASVLLVVALPVPALGQEIPEGCTVVDIDGTVDFYSPGDYDLVIIETISGSIEFVDVVANQLIHSDEPIVRIAKCLLPAEVTPTPTPPTLIPTPTVSPTPTPPPDGTPTPTPAPTPTPPSPMTPTPEVTPTPTPSVTPTPTVTPSVTPPPSITPTPSVPPTPPPPSPPPGTPPELPDTGFSSGFLIAVAVALIVLGSLLWFYNPKRNER